MEAILDSSFIISCIRNRISFLEQLEEQGFKVKVPREVLQEMKDLKNRSGTSHDDKIAIDVALEMLANKKIKMIRIDGKNVDAGLIAKGKEGHYIATLDREIKHSVPNKIVIFKSKGTVGRE